MTTSAPGSAGPWYGDGEISDVAATGAPTGNRTAESHLLVHHVYEAPGPGEGDTPNEDWQQVDETASNGLPTRALVVASASAVAVSALVDLALTGGTMTFFFDLCFVVVCLVASMAVRRSDVFAAGVLPPLVFAAVIAAVSLAQPQALAPGAGTDVAFLTGLADHAPGLVGGYAVALLAIAARVAVPSSPARRPGQTAPPLP